MSDILAEILQHKRSEVEHARVARPPEMLAAQPAYGLPCRNFYGAVTVPRRGGPNLIAEIKRSSPSAGLLRPDFDAVALARTFAAAGAAALSVLTDERYFDGRLEFIEAIKAAVGLPVLRKDFLIDAYQVHESRAFGADAILLIAEALDAATIGTLAGLAQSLGLCVLIEVHSRARLFDVLHALPQELRGRVLLGLNNRDLARQQVDLATTEQLAPLVPPGLPIVAESGIRTRRDVERMHGAGARALLVGEALLRNPAPADAIRKLFG